MNGRFEVWLDSQPMSGVAQNVLITDILEDPAEMDVQTYAKARGNGLYVGRRSRQSISVVVTFVIAEYGTAQRKSAMQQLITWAKAGKYLSISDRPNQRLRVQVDGMPTIASAMRWLQECTITFTAYAFPFWEDEMPETIIVAAGKSATHYIPGNADAAPVDATIQATGGSLTVTTGSTTLSFSGVPAGAVTISHGDDNILRVEAAGASILAKRTPGSSDDLLVTPGQTNSFCITGGSAVFTARGVWE